jgi:hypothetical protein
MKILVAIISCARDVNNGTNQAIRDTWVPRLVACGFDYKFFIGIGPTPREEDLLPRFIEDANFYRDIRYPGCDKSTSLRRVLLKEDEVLVESDDSWLFLPYKVKESRKWALAEGYDFVFKIDTDTYLLADKLNVGGFRHYDYWGGVRKENEFIYAGGSGYMLSKRAYSLTIDEPISMVGEDIGLLFHYKNMVYKQYIGISVL